MKKDEPKNIIVAHDVMIDFENRILYDTQGCGPFEIVDRYSALGIPSPAPETMCKGQCEGTGAVPIKQDDLEEPFRTLWLEAEEKEVSGDGWHFVTCPDCKGTGLRVEA